MLDVSGEWSVCILHGSSVSGIAPESTYQRRLLPFVDPINPAPIRKPVAKAKRRKTSVFTAFGIAVLAFAVLSLLLVVANRPTAAQGGHDLSGAVGPSLLLIVIGVGLLFNRRWAAALFAAICTAVGGWLTFGSLLVVPLPWLFLNVFYGLSLIVPAIVVYRNWSKLD